MRNRVPGSPGPIFLLLVAIAAVNGCSATLINNSATQAGNAPKTTHLAVADSGNNRVLIFDAPFATGMSASIVLGQPGFSGDSWSASTPNSLLIPEGLDLDAAGDLYVADSGDDRLMQFQPTFENGMDANLELGEASFTSPNDCEGLCWPAGTTVDASGNIWIADSGNGRVLEYRAPIQQGMSPSVVIGHPDLSQTTDCDGVDVTGEPGLDTGTTNAAELCGPGTVQFDGNGNLWVADSGNGRVLEFVPPFSNGMAATLELGYPASVGMSSPTPWATGYQCPSATSAINSSFDCAPGGFAFDTQGNLWIADDCCVREFVPPFASGMAASLIVGTPREGGPVVSPTDSVMNGSPIPAIAFDSSGDLIVSDQDDNRVLVFMPPWTAGMSASIVIGQPDMTTGAPHGCGNVSTGRNAAGDPSASTFCQPAGVLAF